MIKRTADTYTKLYSVLEKHYTEKQINEIWNMLIDYDMKLNEAEEKKKNEVSGSIWGK